MGFGAPRGMAKAHVGEAMAHDELARLTTAGEDELDVHADRRAPGREVRAKDGIAQELHWALAGSGFDNHEVESVRPVLGREARLDTQQHGAVRARGDSPG